MKTIFEIYVRPVHALRAEVDALIAKEAINNMVMMQLASTMERLAEAEARLSAINATTACENGKTLSENLHLQQAATYAANVARRNKLMALTESYEGRVKMFRQFINNANGKPGE